MRKFVSMFMALVIAFTMGPVVPVKAENTCEGENCQANEESLTGLAWCKENPKDCATYLGETAWDGTKLVGGKVWNGTKLVGEKIWDETAWVRGKMLDGAADVCDAVRNYNYTHLGENTGWCVNNVKDCAASVCGAPKKWLDNRIDEVGRFTGRLEAFYDYDMKDDAKWPFWTMVGLAAYQGASVALSAIKFTVKLPFTLVMKMFNPCFRARRTISD